MFSSLVSRALNQLEPETCEGLEKSQFSTQRACPTRTSLHFLIENKLQTVGPSYCYYCTTGISYCLTGARRFVTTSSGRIWGLRREVEVVYPQLLQRYVSVDL